MTFRNYFRLLAEGRYKGWETNLWKPFLKLASLMYGMAVSFRRKLYDMKIFQTKRLSIPVISVGNISWGGVGKTPLTMYLSRFFLNEKKIPLILTRGYGSDEAHEYAEELPEVILGIGGNRFQVGQKVLAAKRADVAILDDGFQHFKIDRSLDIVVMNVLNPFGNCSLIPNGILREPLQNLKRADMIIFNDVNLIARKLFEEIRTKVKTFAPKAEMIEAQREPLYFYWANTKDRMDLGRMRGKRVTTFSGVGTPRSFQLLLTNLGVKTIRNFEFADHHPFTGPEIREIQEVKESSQSDFIVTTEKDFLRKEKLITDILNPLILKTSLRITAGELVLRERLRKLLPFEQKELVHV